MQDLYPQQETGFIFIGQGFALKKTSDKNMVQLYKDGTFIKEQILNPSIEKRLFVVDLVERQGVVRTKLADALGISRQSINNWVDTYREYGSNGLINNTKDSWKKNPKRFISKKVVQRSSGNKARDLEQERKRVKQEFEKLELIIDFEQEIQVEEKHIGPAKELYSEEFDYQENRYSGGMLYLAILIHRFNFLKQLSVMVEGYLWVPLLFVMMQINKIASIEQLKTVFREEFGKIIGLKRLAHLEKVRENIGELVNLKQSTQVLGKFFKIQIIKGIVSVWRIFLDGHFVPYTGKGKVHKAYCTQRDMMMPGQTEFYSHDSTGNIVYFDIQEGKGDIVESLRQISSQITSYNNNIPPLVVVDRELWGVDKFLSLSDCRFVTWEKYCDKEALKTLPDSSFSEELTLNGKIYKLFEIPKTYRGNQGKSIELRRIISRNITSGETFAIVTNDKIENTKTIADSMLNRWGCSENGFKHLGTRMNMHYNPLLKIEEESDQQQIDNPAYIALKKKMKSKKTQLSKIQKELGKKQPKQKKDGTPRKSPARERLIKQREELEYEINQLQQEIAVSTPRIDIRQTDSKTYKMIDKEAKKWWNIAEMIFCNSRKNLARQLFNYLPDQRDLLPVLDAITNSKGWIKSTRELLIVRLEPLETPRFKDAQIQLCRHLNNQKIYLPNGKLLQYDVGDNPYDVQK